MFSKGSPRVSKYEGLIKESESLSKLRPYKQRRSAKILFQGGTFFHSLGKDGTKTRRGNASEVSQELYSQRTTNKSSCPNFTPP